MWSTRLTRRRTAPATTLRCAKTTELESSYPYFVDRVGHRLHPLPWHGLNSTVITNLFLCLEEEYQDSGSHTVTVNKIRPSFNIRATIQLFISHSHHSANDVDISGDVGELSSPLYPLRIQSSSSHSWRISTKHGQVMLVTFLDFSFVEEDNVCASTIKVN